MHFIAWTLRNIGKVLVCSVEEQLPLYVQIDPSTVNSMGLLED